MDTAIPPIRPGSVGASFARAVVQTWLDACNEFLLWQRQQVIESKPTPETLSEHRDTLKLMLRWGRGLHAEVSDPDFPLHHFIPEVAGKLHQLQDSWEMIHNPMSDAEADAILQAAFRHEPRAGSPA